MSRPRPNQSISHGRTGAPSLRAGDRRRSGAQRHRAARSPFADADRRADALRLGVRLLLSSIAVLFLATIVAFLVVRFAPAGQAAWRGVRPPIELAASTLLLAASSAALERGVARIRRGDRNGLARWLWVACALGVGFLACQAWCWARLLEALDLAAASTAILSAWMFVVLTALHALHVIGGLAPMSLVAWRAKAGRYTASGHAGVLAARSYWHFLGAAWLGVLATLLVAA